MCNLSLEKKKITPEVFGKDGLYLRALKTTPRTPLGGKEETPR